MSTNNDEVIILTDDTVEQVFVDNSKEPVKIYMDFITGDADDQLTPIWAEKADYLNEERIGEGLENKLEVIDEKNRTFKLNIKPASHDELGGIKLGNTLSIDEDGVVDVNSNTVIGIASDIDLGGVRIGEGINVDRFGTISVDKYELPEASAEKLGGVRVGDGLEVENGFLRVVCNSLANNADLTEEEKELVSLGLTNLDFVVNVLLRMHSEQQKTIEALKERLNAYVDKTPNVQGIIETGTNVFGGNWDKLKKTGGTVITLDKTYENSNYFVIISGASSTVGEIGDYFVRDKKPNSFRVCNTGSVNMDEFYWMVIPASVIFNLEVGGSLNNDPHQIPVKYGKGVFNGKLVDSNKNAIKFDKSMPNVNYAVFITPVVEQDGNGNDVGTPHLGNLGEVYIARKLAREFIVCNTGSDTETSFEWVAIPFDLQNENHSYDPVIFPIHVGSVNIIDGTNPIIKFNNHKFTDKEYKILLQLASNSEGKMGDIYSDKNEKTRTSFKINHSGEALTYSIDWLTID